MMNKLSTFVLLSLVCAILGGSSLAQEKKRVPVPKRAPSLPNTYSKGKPTTGLFAHAAQIVLITDRGAFGLSAVDETGATFEWEQKGYDTKVSRLGSQDEFEFFEVKDRQIIVAVRFQTPFDVYFFINGSSEPIQFVSSG